MASYTPEEYSRLLDRFASGLPEAMARATFVAAQQVEGEILLRIFNDSGTEDVNGSTRQYKSKSHIKKREMNSPALQVGVVDLIFTGNLLASPMLFEKKSSVDLVITGERSVGNQTVENWKIARGNEEYFPSKKVFEASADEDANARKVFALEITKYVNKFFN